MRRSRRSEGLDEFFSHWFESERRKAGAIVRSWSRQEDGTYTYTRYRNPELVELIRAAAAQVSAEPRRIEAILGDLDSYAGVLLLGEESILSDLRRARALRDIRRVLDREGWPFSAVDGKHPLSQETIDNLQREMSVLRYDDVRYQEERLKAIQKEQREAKITKGSTSTDFRKSHAPKAKAEELYHYFAQCLVQAKGRTKRTGEDVDWVSLLSKAERGELQKLVVDLVKCANPLLASRLTPSRLRPTISRKSHR